LPGLTLTGKPRGNELAFVVGAPSIRSNVVSDSGGNIMLSYEDCVELSDLTEEEIEAIAEHEHLPEIAALEMGSYLVHTEEGVPMIKRIILDDIEEERRRGHNQKVLQLKLVLKHFVETHPQHPSAA
jgi:hypothetical protein